MKSVKSVVKEESYEERNVEIYFADARGNTYRDSNKLRSAELHDDDVNIKNVHSV